MSQRSRLLGTSSEQPKRKRVGQRAVLNGKPVMWNGTKWVPAPNHSRSSTQSGQGGRLRGGGTSNTPKKPSRTGSVSSPTNYPTTAVTRTRRPGRDIQAETARTRTRTPSTPSTPARTPAAPKTPAKKSATHTYKKHGSDLHIGRHKTLKEHRAAVAERKKKKPNQSAANRAGYPGNRNY
jgi:hypothetical protein